MGVDLWVEGADEGEGLGVGVQDDCIGAGWEDWEPVDYIEMESGDYVGADWEGCIAGFELVENCAGTAGTKLRAAHCKLWAPHCKLWAVAHCM